MLKSGNPTKYPGVFKIGHKSYRIRGKAINPRTGKQKEVRKVLHDASVREAARVRAEALEEIRKGSTKARERVRIGAYAQSWMRSKALKLDEGTARTYADALDLHVLPTLGDFYYDVLTRQDVQAWVDESLMSVRVLRDGTRKPYSRNSVHAWFRVLRTMTHDAMDDLSLQRNPTLRISFPDAPDSSHGNSLSSRELARFLWEMRSRYPHQFALTAVLSFTGLRFCHGSAIAWNDWDESEHVIRVQRKQVRGRVGKISRKKQAPHEVPVEPELAMILREHRQRMLAQQAPGLAEGWMFPSASGTLRAPSSLNKAWQRCLEAAEIDRRFTIHGLRYTFTDLVRRAKADAVVRRALTGHVTESMQYHYSNVDLEEKRSAVAGVHRLVAEAAPPQAVPSIRGGTPGGTSDQND
ncbi:MAG: site-specific integrase [Proteobacteria bacterium]|nr:site-specific integrase [Pseudomonadota bacterium]